MGRHGGRPSLKMTYAMKTLSAAGSEIRPYRSRPGHAYEVNPLRAFGISFSGVIGNSRTRIPVAL